MAAARRRLFASLFAAIVLSIIVAQPAAQTRRIDLNTATAADLDTLHGIGPVKAEAITQYRTSVGRFSLPTDLMDVPGIGQRTYDGLCAAIEVEGNPGCGRSVAPSEPDDGTPASSTSAGEAININLATEEELQSLTRIGPALSQRIVEHRRRHGLFTSVDGLQAVSGIGPATVDRLRASVTIAGDINVLTAPQLEELDVPTALAEAIILHRDDHGAYSSLSDLAGVEGVTEILIEHLRPFLTVTTQSSAE